MINGFVSISSNKYDPPWRSKPKLTFLSIKGVCDWRLSKAKKEIKKKIKGDKDKVVNEISKYKIKIAFKGKEVKAIGTRTDNLSVAKRPAYKIGELVAITDLSHSMKDKMTGVERDETKDYQFQILTKIKPTFNVKKMDFERWKNFIRN